MVQQPGMQPVPQASEDMLAFITAKMKVAECAVFITHDFFSAALMSFLGLKAPGRESWCNYLEGVCVIDRGDGPTFFRICGIEKGASC